MGNERTVIPAEALVAGPGLVLQCGIALAESLSRQIGRRIASQRGRRDRQLQAQAIAPCGLLFDQVQHQAAEVTAVLPRGEKPARQRCQTDFLHAGRPGGLVDEISPEAL
jgi:hypothetical protein